MRDDITFTLCTTRQTHGIKVHFCYFVILKRSDNNNCGGFSAPETNLDSGYLSEDIIYSYFIYY